MWNNFNLAACFIMPCLLCVSDHLHLPLSNRRALWSQTLPCLHLCTGTVLIPWLGHGVQSTRDCKADGMNLHHNRCMILSPIWFQKLEYSKGLSDSKISFISERNFVYQCLCMERTFMPENGRFSMSLLYIAQ